MNGRIKESFVQLDEAVSRLLEGRSRIVLCSAVFATGVVIFAFYSVQLGPIVSFDVKNYHFYNAHAMMTGRLDYDYAAAQIQTYLNPLSFVPFYLMATHSKPVVGGFIMGGIHGLSVGVLFLIALALFSSMRALPRLLLALACAALGVYGPTFLALLGGPHNNNLVNLIVLIGVYALIKRVILEDTASVRRARMLLVIAGLMLGIAMGLKLVCTVFLLACAIALFFTDRGWRSLPVTLGMFGVACVIGVLLSRGFWMATMWSKFGSPLFPFYNTIFDSPYYYNENHADLRYLPKTVVDAIFYPFHYFRKTHYTDMHHHFRDIRYALIYVLAILYPVAIAVRWAIAAMRRRLSGRSAAKSSEAAQTDNTDRADAFLLIFFIVSYVIWQLKFSIFRYVGPLELLAPMVMVVFIGLIFRNSYVRAAAIIVVFSATAWIMKPIQVPRDPVWGAEYFDVKAPTFNKPGDIMVILANNRPWSYVIPYFQPEVRFVGLINSFSHPSWVMKGKIHRATEEMLELVRAHKGQMFLLSSPQHVGVALKNLAEYNIVALTDKCRVIETKHEPVPICLLLLGIQEPQEQE